MYCNVQKESNKYLIQITKNRQTITLSEAELETVQRELTKEKHVQDIVEHCYNSHKYEESLFIDFILWDRISDYYEKQLRLHDDEMIAFKSTLTHFQSQLSNYERKIREENSK